MSFGFPPRKHHTLPRQRQARQMPGGFKRKSKSRHVHHHLWRPNRNRTTGGLKQKGPIPILECSPRGQLGRVQRANIQCRGKKIKCRRCQETREDEGLSWPIPASTRIHHFWAWKSSSPHRPTSVEASFCPAGESCSLPLRLSFSFTGVHSWGHLASLPRGPTTQMSFGGLP